jgi:hypothetical protein
MTSAVESVSRRARVLGRIARTAFRHARAERRLRADGAQPGPDSVLLILGCQRSGTTLVSRVLDRDPEAKVHPEQSSLSVFDLAEHLRLPSTPRLAGRLASSRHPLVVLKPLVESQNASKLLDGLTEHLSPSRTRVGALWMFRHWTDVARSNLARFGLDNGLRNLGRVVARRSGDWRAEHVPDRVYSVVAEHFSESMDPHDAAALFWWVRNAHFFELGLGERPDVRTCRYEELVAEPERVLRGVYRFADRPFPGEHTLRGVSTASVGLGSGVDFSSAIAALCDETFERLRVAHEKAGTCT